VFKFESMNSDEAIKLVKDLEIDVVVNMRTRCIYKRPILEAPHLGCINIHHGLLPEYRGTLCDLYALSEGRPAGFSIHHMVEKVDAGALYKRCEVGQGDRNYQEYLKRSAITEAKILSEIFSYIEKEGRLPEPLAIHSPTPHHYSKTPNHKQIRAMIDQGLIL
ncbi:MAG: formyltransferase family protein, partial [Bdellovibrionota bacterium]